MWSYHPELLANPVPRYTSYPTAAEFHDGIGETVVGEGHMVTNRDMVEFFPPLSGG